MALMTSRDGRFSIFFLSFTLIQTVLAQDDRVLRDAKLPEWVIDHEIAADVKEPADDPSAGGDVWFLMADRQINVRNRQFYRHYAYRFTSQNGIEDRSQLSIGFDPSYQTLIWHRLRIHRDDQVIDRLDSQEIKVVQRETRHERQMYDGSLSAIVVIDDVRLGDVLEYAYSIVGANPVFENHFSHTEATRWSQPVHQARFRILWEKERPLEMRNFGSSVEPTKGESGDLNEITLHEDDVPALIADGEVPSHYITHPWIEFSDYGSWREMAQWAWKQYDLSQELPADLMPVLERLKELDDPKEKIRQALRWTQEEIRYLGLFEGMHSHRPHAVSSIMERRFGDCKDKSILLTIMLRHLGIEAFPALVGTGYKHRVAEWLPNPASFNHLIVNAKWNGRNYWLDPTRSYQQAGIDTLFSPAYGYALVVAEDTRTLTKVEPSGFEESYVEITETYSMEDYSGRVGLEVVTRYSGNQASLVRSTFASNSLQSLQKDYLDFYSKEYASIETAAPLEVEDFSSEDLFVTTERYEIANAWIDSDEPEERMTFETYARFISGSIDQPGTRIRQMPYALDHPKNVAQTIILEFPTKIQLADDLSSIDNPAFEFALEEKASPKRLELCYRYRSKADQVTAEAMPQYLADTDEAKNLLGYYIFVPERYRRMTLDEIESSFESSASIESPGDVNWMLVALVAMTLTVAFIGAWFGYRWDPSPRPPPNPWPSELVGISGWLVLIAIGTVTRPLISIWSIGASLMEMDMASWLSISDPSSELYHPLWVPGVTMELVILCVGFALEILILVLFFTRRTSLPRFEIAYFVFWMASAIFSLALFESIDSFDPDSLGEYRKDVFRALMQSAIWIPYFLVSKRVACTFVRRYRAGATPPPLPPQQQGLSE